MDAPTLGLLAHDHAAADPPPARRPGGPSNAGAKWQLVAAGVFCLLFMCAEVVGGYFAHSLAIMTE